MFFRLHNARMIFFVRTGHAKNLFLCLKGRRKYFFKIFQPLSPAQKSNGSPLNYFYFIFFISKQFVAACHTCFVLLARPCNPFDDMLHLTPRKNYLKIKSIIHEVLPIEYSYIDRSNKIYTDI